MSTIWLPMRPNDGYGFENFGEEHKDYSTVIDIENNFTRADSSDIIKLVA